MRACHPTCDPADTSATPWFFRQTLPQAQEPQEGWGAQGPRDIGMWTAGSLREAGWLPSALPPPVTLRTQGQGDPWLSSQCCLFRGASSMAVPV